jgi:FAD/FMN-containing dehydrogenase
MTSITDPTGLATLKAQLTGPLFVPGDPGYADEVAGFNVAVNSTPAVVVGAATAQDVQAAVRFAAASNLPVGVLATGHGSVVFSEGVTITTRRMNDVQVDPDAKTAAIGAGVKWAKVIEEAAPHGLAPLNGSSSDVGVVGYTLGGGLPVMGRTFGFSADHVVSLEVVTADGELRDVDANSEPDLFWGLRGGQHNLGIVTSITVELMPVRTLYGGGIYYAAEHMATVVHAYREWCLDLPDEMTTSLGLLRLPPLPTIPEPLRGKTLAHLCIAYVGDADQGAKLIAPMRDVAPAIIDMVGEMPYTAIDSVHQDPDHPVPFMQKGILLREFTAETADALLDVAGADKQVAVLLCDIRQLGGALRRPPAGGNACSGRDAQFSALALGMMAPPIADLVPGAVATVIDALQPWSTGKTFVNFHGDPGDETDRARAWDDASYQRLLELAGRYDPAGLFRFGHAIGRATQSSAPTVPPQGR